MVRWLPVGPFPEQAARSAVLAAVRAQTGKSEAELPVLSPAAEYLVRLCGGHGRSLLFVGGLAWYGRRQTAFELIAKRCTHSLAAFALFLRTQRSRL